MRKDIDYDEVNDIERDGDIFYNFKEDETVWLDKGQINQIRVRIIEFLEDGLVQVAWFADVIEVNVGRLSKLNS